MVELTKYSIVTCLFFIYALNIFGQNKVENLFENKQYEDVIDLLSKKDEVDILTLREYYMLTRSYGRTGQYANGLVFAKKMQDIAIEANDTIQITKAANLAAENFVDLNEIEDGLRYCEVMSSFFREKDSVEYQKFCFKLGVLYYYNKDYEKAYETYNKITIPKYRNITLFYNNYALTLTGVKKLDEAIVYYKKALDISYKKGNLKSINTNLSNIAHSYINKRDWKQAKVYLDSSANSFTDKSNLSSKKTLYEHYFDFYRSQGKLSEASNVLKEINDLNQELFRKRLSEKLQALETSNKREYTLKKKVKIIDDQLVVSQKQKLWGAFIFLLIIIGLLFVLFLYKYRNIKAAHENIVTEQRLLRAQMNPHFIFNSLSVLQGMILNKEDKKAVKYVSKFSKLLRIILESSREKMVPINEELEALNNYVSIQNMGRQVPFKYTLHLDEHIEAEELLIPPMLIQPFIENAIEHGFKKHIENAEIIVTITFKDQKLQCEIKDNGIGIDSNIKSELKNKKSLATKITSERLKIISKQYNIESDVIIQDRNLYNEQGTQVVLVLPYKINKNA